jgi:DNA-binding protein
MSQDNVIYIGRKPAMTYVMAVIATMNNQDNEVILKARGRAISTAVDVAEICRTRYFNDIGKPKIEIGTEELENQYGGTRNVSTISIVMKKAIMNNLESQDTQEKETSLDMISGVGEVTAKKLMEVGYISIDKVAEANVNELAEKTGISVKIIEKIIESAKKINS